MRPTFLFLLAALAMTALAAVPHYDRRDVALPHEGDTNILEEQDFDLANVSTSGFDKRWSTDENPILLYAGGPRQHVGTLRKNRLTYAIARCLSNVAIPMPGREGKHPDFCASWDPRCAMECRINNIVYNSGGNTYATDAFLAITVSWAEILEKDHPGLREAIFWLAGSIYADMAESNCYVEDFTGSRRTTMCNVPLNLIIWLPWSKDRSRGAVLNIGLNFNGKTTEGPLDCEKSLKPIGANLTVGPWDAVAGAMNWKTSIGTRLISACQNYWEVSQSAEIGYGPSDLCLLTSPWSKIDSRVPQCYERGLFRKPFLYQAQPSAHPRKAHREGDVLMPPNDAVEHAGPEDIALTDNGLILPDLDLDLTNTTTNSSTLIKPWTTDQNPFLLYAGGPMQHVGTLRSACVRDKIYDCVKLVSETGTGVSLGDKGPHPEWCAGCSWTTNCGS
ncbi:hypothetical protein EK21DRAFT_94604 [Setomelanomma holmii]|uniref:Uncharacterized protein n=1 Tax=Setomelanomma holmii TaxID=210430 RepID=A0A9P4LG34_9PLEO|nr:hypothetical protein EK21DRAFT_94604 [Setomelanomma holmii]